jgi:3-oxoacyl-[acyl-carrier-protein] synthase-3
MEIKNAYITSVGSYLPGPPVNNDQIESVLGMIGGKPSRLRSRILKNNGIQTRHYAIDNMQRSTEQNCDLATHAVRNCIDESSVGIEDIDMLAVATTQGDLPLPGLASMVQAEAGIPACEIITTHGVCSAGMMALKTAVNNVRLGEKKRAVACASELASRLLKKSRYEAADGSAVDFEAEFLRWMLSDGSGAVLVEPQPRERGLSLRVEWIEIISHASDFDLCMSCGTADQRDWALKDEMLNNVGTGNVQRESSVAVLEKTVLKERSWQDYSTYAQAEKAGALLIRQNLRILDNIVKVGVDGFIRLIADGKIQPNEIDHFLCHYSSHFFRGRILDLFKLCGCMIPEDRWFTNLYDKGNTGCASIFIMLDELFHSNKLRPGQTVFCVVPESGRFTTAYMKLTVVEGSDNAY